MHAQRGQMCNKNLISTAEDAKRADDDNDNESFVRVECMHAPKRNASCQSSREASIIKRQHPAL